VVPDVTHDADRFVQAILGVLARYPARVIIPSHDGTIEALRAYRREVERVTAVALASESALTIAVDKARTLAVAQALGIAVPRGVIVQDVRDVRAAMREVGAPAVVKPLQSWVERDGIATRLACEAVLNEDEAKRAVATMLQAGGSAVLQEWLPGSREAVSLLYARGHMWARFAQVAHRMYPPLGGSSVLRESITLPLDAADAAERLIRAIDLEGYSEIEFRRDRAGKPVLMEINPRLSASVEIAVRAGVNFPSLVYAWAAGDPLKRVPGYRTGLRMRWLGGDLYYLKETYLNQGRPDIVPTGHALRTFFLDFLRPTGFDYVDMGDVRPALTASGQLLRHFGQRAIQRFRP
jgi:predicted ATP-grasp superfamily ATP-dependent carboligase